MGTDTPASRSHEDRPTPATQGDRTFCFRGHLRGHPDPRAQPGSSGAVQGAAARPTAPDPASGGIGDMFGHVGGMEGTRDPFRGP